MLLWHLGVTLFLVRWIFRDPKMDLRWVLLGSILPDLVDKPIAAWLFHDSFGTHRAFAHAIVLPVVALFVILVVTRRSTVARKAAIAVVIGWFLHLVLDAAWLSPEAFLWPLFGFGFPRIAGSDLGTLVVDMLTSPWTWAGEAIGAAYLVAVWRRHLGASGELGRFFREGTIPMPRP